MDPSGGQAHVGLAQRLAALKPSGLALSSWEDFGSALEGIDDPEMLRQAQLSLDGNGPFGAEHTQAGELIAERITELSSPHDSRMLRAASTIGLEFQDLDSTIEVLDGADVTGPVTRVVTRFCGEDARWQLTADGKNLEFVTAPTWNRLELVETLAEIQQVYATLWANGGGQYRVGGVVFRITHLSGTAQPQYNVDMPVDLLFDFVKDLGKAAGKFQDFFGADTKYWKLQNTIDEIEVVLKAAEVIAGLEAAAYDRLVPAAVRADADAMRLVRGYLLLLAMCAVHQTEFPTVVFKDQPLLHKINLSTAADFFVYNGYLEKLAGDTPAVIAALTLLTSYKAVLTPTRESAIALDRIRGELAAGKDPSWDREGSPIMLPLRSPRWASIRPRAQVVMELRRVPVLPAAQWTAAALAAFDYFVADTARRFN